jgi:hypothetical protein
VLGHLPSRLGKSPSIREFAFKLLLIVIYSIQSTKEMNMTPAGLAEVPSLVPVKSKLTSFSVP